MNRNSECAPTLSVILPVYNAKSFVERAVESILCQSFSDFELIIIDDGSFDGTTSVLKSFAGRDRRIVLVIRENRGLVASLNEGISIAQGEFIARMDADDIALPTRFAEQLDFLRRSQLDLCGTFVQCFGGSKRVWRYPATPEEVAVQLLFDSPYAHPSILCRATVYKRLSYREDFAKAEDFDLWQRAWQLGFRGGNLQKILLKYRVHASQISSAQNVPQQILADSIRRRQWRSVAGDLYDADIQILLDIFREGRGDLVEIESLLQLVVHQYKGPAQKLFLDQAFRVGVRAAVSSQRPWKVWRDIVEGSDMGRSRWKEFLLFAIWMVGLGPRNWLYRTAKSWYLNRL